MRSTMIETLTKYGYAPVKISDKHGGEYACPCPWCGGKDRLRIFPKSIFGGKFRCRNCGIGGGVGNFVLAVCVRGIPQNPAHPATIRRCPRCDSKNIVYGHDTERIFMACRDCEKKGPREWSDTQALKSWNSEWWRFVKGWRG